MPLQATSGAASYDAYGGGVAVVPTYIEDVFSTWLYTGTNASQTITNNIDLSTKGGLVWSKSRSAVGDHHFYDTARGIPKVLFSNGPNASTTYTSGYDLTSFNTTGFSLGPDDYGANTSGVTYASWTFRKQPKFFDVVTWTGTGSNTTISHALGSVPACIMVKRTDTTGDWQVYHRSLANTEYLVLNSTAAKATGATRWNSTTPTSTVFSLGTDATVNASGGTYVAYIFAHDAGGFGLTGTDNVISCGSFTPSGGVATINLGYEPQWILSKVNSAGYYWRIVDNMRGIPVSPPGSNTAKVLYPNATDAEASSGDISPTATGFTVDGQPDFQTIYIAIRRGPMKVPTTGTSVYNGIVRNGTAANATVTGVGFPVDLAFTSRRAASHLPVLSDRLRGAKRTLSSSGTYEEQTETIALTSFASMDGVSFGADNTGYFNGFNNANGASYINWFFRRSPSFMDVVCYTGTGTGGRTVTHNLTVAPEMIIAKNRSGAANLWLVYTQPTGASGVLQLASNAALVTPYFDWVPTSTTFSVGAQGFGTNDSGVTYVAYLFATCAGVSKVGSYTGTATTKQIDCGFTAGARFVLIKRTDSNGDWYVWDTARGIISGDDPYLLINTENAETTNTDYIDTYSAGFEISSTAPAAINASGGTYIFLAIA